MWRLKANDRRLNCYELTRPRICVKARLSQLETTHSPVSIILQSCFRYYCSSTLFDITNLSKSWVKIVIKFCSGEKKKRERLEKKSKIRMFPKRWNNFTKSRRKASIVQYIHWNLGGWPVREVFFAYPFYLEWFPHDKLESVGNLFLQDVTSFLL